MPNKIRSKLLVNDMARLETFSDGVFAIAITLLVLNIRVPISSELTVSLLAQLGSQWAAFVAFFIGFYSILVCWINHHFMCRFIRQCDHVMLIINSLVLLATVLVPFSTALLAEYIGKPEQQTAVAIYGVTYVVMSLVYSAMWNYAHNHRQFLKAGDSRFFIATRLMYRIGIVYTIVVLGISFINVIAALILYALLFFIYSFPEVFAQRLARTQLI